MKKKKAASLQRRPRNPVRFGNKDCQKKIGETVQPNAHPNKEQI
jgi:hypothetical protein